MMVNINGKEWESLTIQDIVQHLKENCDDETFFFEFKADGESNNGIAKEICAFANTYGGYLFIGVDNDKRITGSPNWTEERINNIIYNSISPTPIFDIKKFITEDGLHLFVIKIEEGVDPPFIATNKGVIYQRVSSSSCPVKDAVVLNHLYNKRIDNMAKLKDKIGIDSIDPVNFPVNLCATLDVGFSFISKNLNKQIKKFNNANLEKIAQTLKDKCKMYSITRVGNSYIFIIGYVGITNTTNYRLPSDLHNFIEIMCDGSVRYRILFGGDVHNDKVDISQVILISDLYENIYYEIFGEELSEQFISAYKYDYLHVYRQFTPVYDIDEPAFINYLSEHKNKYGNNLVITSSRLPKTGYDLIDKREFEHFEKEFNSKNVAELLIHSDFTIFGYIDLPKIPEEYNTFDSN